MSQPNCPRCGSRSRAIPGRVPSLRAAYTCRDAWHMPALSEEAESALELMAHVYVMFEYDPYRQTTSRYPGNKWDPMPGEGGLQ